MKRIKAALSCFTKTEWLLWMGSVILVTVAFVIFDRSDYLTLVASLLGVTSLIFNAKGNPIGQLLMVAFSLLYGIISFGFAYYGEMLTYLGMTMPMAAASFVSWIKNPYNGNRSQVKVKQMLRSEWVAMWIWSVFITAIFYFILKHFGTANLIPSTISVTTSFVAVYLTFKRSAYYAIGYAANDLVLVVLWLLAALETLSYMPVAVCFIVFLVNDIYGFTAWQRMGLKQANETDEAATVVKAFK